VHFLTGVDEHGQKVQASARKKAGHPAAAVRDEVSAGVPGAAAEAQHLQRRLHPHHRGAAQEGRARLLQQLFDKGEIYQAEYKGFYSTRQEQFLQEKDRLPDGTWPEIFGEVTEIVESNYFFKLRAVSGLARGVPHEEREFHLPAYRQKQVLEFLKEPLNDLCISRPKERLEWGIPLPFDEGYVTYVWFDALLNYYSAVADRPDVWREVHHVIGKDILVPPHAVYWPIMLHAAGMPLPKGIIAHGWWLQRGAKMSKSTGNALNPLDLVTEFGTDAFRYFLMREMNVGQDSDFTREQFLVRYNSELANNLGNLVNRTLNMTTALRRRRARADARGCDGARAAGALGQNPGRSGAALRGLPVSHRAGTHDVFRDRDQRLHREARALETGQVCRPRGSGLLRTSLATMAEALRLATALLRAVMPGTTERINAVIGHKPGADWRQELTWGTVLTGNKVAEALVLFPRPAPADKAAKP
jgi:methionyl-tRNA synthetase